ncbi:MAG: hypothetical protein PHS17_19905, partial [Desulfobacterales bacterium]|nr:hypothetical protein [Desulfobacterales bacterium]
SFKELVIAMGEPFPLLDSMRKVEQENDYRCGDGVPKPEPEGREDERDVKKQPVDLVAKFQGMGGRIVETQHEGYEEGDKKEFELSSSGSTSSGTAWRGRWKGVQHIDGPAQNPLLNLTEIA